ncbi:hypothetical protein [Streptomyces spiramenti]|uniref:Uncharacterized protein n=1 Tax=Streptomyces spiramenti TaxID=2720606 RepID=A0ABX1AK28_9ACTN|nr:hypothetical protein [Streptomyces spiramenti]NJP64737.1 hypothetical protein [Streptomyces spiramenti]
MPFADIAPSRLEDWLRERCFTTTVGISSSEVADYSLGELRRLLNLAAEELDAIPLRDGPSHGSPDLRAAIAGRYGVPQHHVTVSHGSTEGIFRALRHSWTPVTRPWCCDRCTSRGPRWPRRPGSGCAPGTWTAPTGFSVSSTRVRRSGGHPQDDLGHPRKLSRT